MMVVFDDTTVIRHALAFEAALATAEAGLGLIPASAAQDIAEACRTLEIDPAALAAEATLAGTLAIPLVARLRAALVKESAATVHYGATSQDVADTVLMLQLKAAGTLLQGDLDRTAAALAILAQRYATTPAMGRTLLQDALPISFGLRIAQWRAGIDEAANRLRVETAAHLCLQLGGAAGSRAGLEGKGAAIAAEMAQILGLASVAPWHARRNGTAAIAAALGILIGALGKMARDVSLLSQSAIGEAREPLIGGRGGSSAMAHKRNPTACQIALSAASRSPGLVAAMLAGLPQELERGLGGWQAEAPLLADLFLLAAGGAEAMASVAEGLEVDEAVIARNLASANVGSDIGESEALVADLLAATRKAR
jgi:3-carboxy-cis,cis-muconate cycloisomerase